MRPRMLPILIGAGMFGGGDSVAPTVVITSSESSPTTANPIPITITFSEEVTGFVVGDITVSDGSSAGNLATSDNIVFTADITPVAGTVTVDIGAGVCTDLAGNANEAATQLSIMSYVGAVAWNDTFEIANLAQDNAGSIPVTGDGDLVGYISDKTGNSSILTQATDGNKGIYRIINGYGVVQFDQVDDVLNGVNIIQKDITVFLYAGNYATDVFDAIIYQGGNDRVAMITRATSAQFVQRDASTLIGASGTLTPSEYSLLVGTYKESPRAVKLRINGTLQVGTTASYTPAAGPNYVQRCNFCERIVFPSVLSEEKITEISNYLIAKRTGIGAGGTLMVAFGDSVTSGDAATAAGYRWANIVTNTKGWNLQNSGVSGTVLQNTVQNTVAVIGGAVAGNGLGNYAARITAYNPNYVVILYGLNDLRLNDVAFTASEFQTDLGTLIDNLTGAGISAGNIVIGSPPYIPNATYSLFSPYDGGDATKHAAYVAACAAVATAKSTKYANVYQAMVDGGGDTLISGDGLHPNDDGHAVIAAAILAVL